MATSAVQVKPCSHPGCKATTKPGQLACNEHWYALSPRLRDRLVFAWEQRKAHPDVPELVHIHRALLLEALQEWGFTKEQIRIALQMAPRARPGSCPMCGAGGGMHRVGCPKIMERD